MNDALREKITTKLREMLNREPLEREIQNGQTDLNLMMSIMQENL